MRRSKWSSTVLEVFCALVTALILTWTIAHVVPTTVHTPAQLRDVAFGWPFPWYHQDLRRYEPATFPDDMYIVGDRVDPLPTTVDVFALTGDVLVTAVILWLVVGALIALLRPRITRALDARRKAHSRET
ncbi:hypothetical protein LTA6_001090 [Microbacterium sp. LTA6]|uniref:hypothetical protein n=1 Tax=Microbacterium sp. LTA6 TaxID=3129771 RepID=UPI003247BE91